MCFRGGTNPCGDREANGGGCGVEETGDELGAGSDGSGGSGDFTIGSVGDEVCR